MCLIAHYTDQRPTRAELRRIASHNRDGAGIAYADPRQPELVTWHKGLTSDEGIALALNAPLPFVAHFRIATHGGTSAKLTHPFPITRKVGLALEGSAKSVLFHNGIWDNFRDFERKATDLTGANSDSRIMAWVLNRFGTEKQNANATLIAKTAGRLLILNQHTVTRFGDGWTQGTKKNGMTKGAWYSNDHSFMRTSVVPNFNFPTKNSNTPPNQRYSGTTCYQRPTDTVDALHRAEALITIPDQDTVHGFQHCPDDYYYDYQDNGDWNQDGTDTSPPTFSEKLLTDDTDAAYTCASCKVLFTFDELDERYDGTTRLDDLVLCQDCGPIMFPDEQQLILGDK